MKLTSFEAIVRTLHGAKVRYLVAGGLAVNAHGYARFTNDVDLVIHLTEADILGAFKALGKIGYRPIVPITAVEFADPKDPPAFGKSKKNDRAPDVERPTPGNAGGHLRNRTV